MNLEDVYKISKDNIRPVRYSEKTLHSELESNLDIKSNPTRYSGKTIHTEAESNLDIKITPKKYHG
jgi:hypothetical protein